LLEQLLDVALDLELLRMNETQPRNEQCHMTFACLDHTWRNMQSLRGKALSDLFRC
jgi:hypothetical protein